MARARTLLVQTPPVVLHSTLQQDKKTLTFPVLWSPGFSSSNLLSNFRKEKPIHCWGHWELVCVQAETVKVTCIYEDNSPGLQLAAWQVMIYYCRRPEECSNNFPFLSCFKAGCHVQGTVKRKKRRAPKPLSDWHGGSQERRVTFYNNVSGATRKRKFNKQLLTLQKMVDTYWQMLRIRSGVLIHRMPGSLTWCLSL